MIWISDGHNIAAGSCESSLRAPFISGFCFFPITSVNGMKEVSLFADGYAAILNMLFLE